MKTPVSAADLSLSGVTGNVTLLELIAHDSSPAVRQKAGITKPKNTKQDLSAISFQKNTENRLNTTLDLYGLEDAGAEIQSWSKVRRPGESKIFSIGSGMKFEAHDENSNVSPIAILEQQNSSRTRSDLKDTPKGTQQKAPKLPKDSNSDPLYIFKPVDVYVKGFKNIENLDRDYRIEKSQERLILARRGVKINQVGEPGYLTLRAKEYFGNGKLSTFPDGSRVVPPANRKGTLVAFSPPTRGLMDRYGTSLAKFAKINPKSPKASKSPKSPTIVQNDQTIFITSDATQMELTAEESSQQAVGTNFGVSVNGRKLHSDIALQREAKRKFDTVEDSKIRHILEDIFVGCERKIYSDRLNRRLSDIGNIKKLSEPNYADRTRKLNKQKQAEILKGLSNTQILEYYSKFLERKASLARTAALSSRPHSPNPGTAHSPADKQDPNTKPTFGTEQPLDKADSSRNAVIVHDSRSAEYPSRSVMWTVHHHNQEGKFAHQHSQVSQGSPARGSVSGESLTSAVQSTGRQHQNRRFKFKEGHFWFNPNAVDIKQTAKKAKESANNSPVVSKWPTHEDQGKDFSFKPSYHGQVHLNLKGRLYPQEQDSVAGGMQLSYFEGEQTSNEVKPYLQDSPSQSYRFRRDGHSSAHGSPGSKLYGILKADGSTTVQSPWSPPGKLLRQPAVSEFGLPMLSERIKAGLHQHEQLQRLPAYQTRLEELAAHLKKGEI